MKKLTFILALAAFASFSSCSKEKDCECTTTSSQEGVEAVVTNQTTTKKCSELDSEVTNGGITVKVVCKEK